MTQLEFLFLAALISGAASYICSRRRKGKKLCATRRNLYCATGIVSSALMALLIGMAATAAIRFCVSYGRIGAAAEAVSDAIIIGITAFPLIWRILFCVRPVWQGCGMDGSDALQDRALVYSDRFWHYHDAEWYISVGVGTAIVLRRSAVDAQRAAVILGETLTMGKSNWSYAVLIIPLKNGKTYRAILGNDECFPDWLRLCGIKIE